MQVLMVVHNQWWERKCPPFWPQMYQALNAHPQVTIKVTGPNWKGYDQEQSLRENVASLMPEAEVLFLWRPFGIVEFCGVRGADEPMPQLKVSAYQDDPVLSRKEATRAGLDLLFYHDLWDAQFYAGCGIESAYIPLAVDLNLYKNWVRPIPSRQIPVLLTGNCDQKTYPLRWQASRLIQKNKIPGQVRRRSPYRMPALSRVLAEQQHYADQLCNAKISIVSSCPHIPLTLRKYFESLAAGCVVVGDMPFKPPEDVRERFVCVPEHATDEQLARIVKDLLADPAKCEGMRVGNRAVAERYGFAQFAERWVTAVSRKLAEKRGAE